MRPATRPNLAATAGYSLVEMLVAMGVLTMVMGTTLAGLADVMKGNELVMTISSMNNALRAGVDVMIRDLLQAGSGLPASHTVGIPNGAGSVRVRLPGPPNPANTIFETAADDDVLPAVITRNGAGPTIDGVATDVLTVLMADNSFIDVPVTLVDDSRVRIATTMTDGTDVMNLGAGVDRILPGQLMLISKGSRNTLVQVTSITLPSRQLNFANGDSLRLNQSGAASGNLRALNLAEPLDNPATATVNEAFAGTRISRMRMITYYLDNLTDPMHPRLVRRINNGVTPGDEITFSNNLGTAVAIDTHNLQFTYDINNGETNPSSVSMTATDYGTGGACKPVACSETEIRKVNLRLMSRAPNQVSGSFTFLENALESQVSLRAMAFVDRYR